MNTAHPEEVKVLENTLAEVRRVRRYRTMRKLAIVPLLLVAGAGWLAFTQGNSTATAAPIHRVAEVSPVTGAAGESLTVVEWNGGTPSLVEYSGKDLGKLELSFSLEPVVAFPEEVW